MSTGDDPLLKTPLFDNLRKLITVSLSWIDNRRTARRGTVGVHKPASNRRFGNPEQREEFPFGVDCGAGLPAQGRRSGHQASLGDAPSPWGWKRRHETLGCTKYIIRFSTTTRTSSTQTSKKSRPWLNNSLIKTQAKTKVLLLLNRNYSGTNPFDHSQPELSWLDFGGFARNYKNSHVRLRLETGHWKSD